jgi:hypothetical protein
VQRGYKSAGQNGFFGGAVPVGIPETADAHVIGTLQPVPARESVCQHGLQRASYGTWGLNILRGVVEIADLELDDRRRVDGLSICSTAVRMTTQ